MSRIKSADEYLLDEINGDLLPEFGDQATSAELYDAGWRPRLNPIQRQAYNHRSSKFKLYDGPRGSGKSIGALHECVDHAFNNDRAIVVIITQTTSQAQEGGTWFKLNNLILPEWGAPSDGDPVLKHINGDPVCGIGLEFSNPRLDPNTRKHFVYVANRFGTHSRIVFLSLPVASNIQHRMKGTEPSFGMVDEAQNFGDDSIFKYLIQQIGRHPFAKAENQMMLYCCNPDGPKHWLYKRFFEYPLNEETGEWNPLYYRKFFPISDNIRNLKEGYYDNVMEACRADPIEYARMVRGEWIDAPEGDAIFKDQFTTSLHVRGDAIKGNGLVPSTEFPVLAGYDLGPAHSSIHFLQQIMGRDKTVWIVFDELNFVEKRMPYYEIVPLLIQRMAYWDRRMKFNFTWKHISDNSAFNQIRTDGSFDHQTVERLSKGRIKMMAAPKGKGSVATRVRMVMDMLVREELFISATCLKTIDMFMALTSDTKKNNRYDPEGRMTPKRSKHIHVFDSMTYPIITAQSSVFAELWSNHVESPSHVTWMAV